MVEELFSAGDVDAIEAADPVGGGVGVEGGADFGWFEGADPGDGKADEVDHELFAVDVDVAGDGARGGVGGAPGSLILRMDGEGEE